MNLDAQYWESRYSSGDYPWDLGGVSDPLKEIIDGINNKNARILIPGAGNAHEAIYLLDNGFTNITVLDIAHQPIALLKNRVEHDNRITIVHQDFFKHQGHYEIILEQTFFCALEPRFRESYVQQTHNLLNDRGVLTGVLFNFESHRDHPPYPASREDYYSLFNPLFEVIKLEPAFNSHPERMNKELFFHFIKRSYDHTDS